MVLDDKQLCSLSVFFRNNWLRIYSCRGNEIFERVTSFFLPFWITFLRTRIHSFAYLRSPWFSWFFFSRLTVDPISAIFLDTLTPFFPITVRGIHQALFWTLSKAFGLLTPPIFHSLALHRFIEWITGTHLSLDGFRVQCRKGTKERVLSQIYTVSRLFCFEWDVTALKYATEDDVSFMIFIKGTSQNYDVMIVLTGHRQLKRR